MYEMVMAVSTEAMALAGDACDESAAGNFAAASRGLRAAAGVMDNLAEDQLPKWIARGSSVEDENLPCEATVGCCSALRTLYLGMAQQMAVATVLVKPGTPNWGLLSKLTLGISEQMDLFMTVIRGKARPLMDKISNDFFSLIAFQSNLQQSLSLYFQARGIWDSSDRHGIAIRLLHEATTYIKTRDSISSRGLPDIKGKSPLKALAKDLTDLRVHMRLILKVWEKDNSTVYFDKVPQIIPEAEKLSHGIMMMKADAYSLAEVDPAPLQLPSGAADNGGPPKATASSDRHMSDEEYARTLQESLGGIGAAAAALDSTTPARPPSPKSSSSSSTRKAASMSSSSPSLQKQEDDDLARAMRESMRDLNIGGGGSAVSSRSPSPPPYSSPAVPKPVMTFPAAPRPTMFSTSLPPPVPVPGKPSSIGLNGRKKTDEEIAREMQDKFNAGEDI